MKGSRLWSFVALCVLLGSGWLEVQAWPSEMEWPFGSCIHFALIGIVAFGVATFKGDWRELPKVRPAGLAIAGLCLFAVPSAALQITGGKVPEYTSAAVFCAIPLMTILTAIAFSSEQPRALMMPSMMGLAGALLLFPIQSPGSLSRWLSLALVLVCCAIVAVASIWMHRLMQAVDTAIALAVVGPACAAALGVYGASIGWPRLGFTVLATESLRCAVFDLPTVWMLLWLVREVSPARLAARFLLVPLVTIVEGYSIERGPLDTRAVLAMALLCAGGTMLLFKDEPEEAPGFRLR